MKHMICNIFLFLTILNLFFCDNNLNTKEKKNTIDPIFKVKVLYSEIPSKIKKIAHCSHLLKNFFILNEDGNVFFTNNFGDNYDSIQKKLEKFDDGDKIIEIIQNPKDLKNIIFASLDQIYWQTNDCGENFNLILDGSKIKQLLFHPIDKKKIILNQFYDCKNSNNKDCIKEWKLMLSKDQGYNWVEIADNVQNYTWAKYYYEDFFSSINRIIFTESVSIKNGFEEYWMYTDNFFKTKNLISKEVEEFKMSNEFLFIKKYSNNRKKYQYYSSNIFGFFYHFRPIQLDIIPEYSYDFQFLTSDTNGLTYIVINYEVNKIIINNLYFSINFGTKFEIILENLVCIPELSECDIHFVQSIQGVLIANIYDENYMVNFNNIPSKKKDDYFLTDKINKMSEKIKTQISFDYGKTWSDIKKPIDYVNKENIHCFNCKLNLVFSNSEENPSKIMDSKYAPGIIIGLGQISEFYDENIENSLFISKDGGLNWTEILKGNYSFEIVNRGNFILAYEKEKETNIILISHDWGETWRNITIISKDKMFIDGIEITNLKLDKKFIVHGYRKEKNKENSILVTVNLDEWHEKFCEMDDYEIFEPINLTSNDKCFNGREIQYFRKKKDRLCFNKLNFELFKIKKHCKCTENDWNCDFGYERNEKNECVLVTEKNKNELLFRKELKGIYEFNNNFEKHLAPKNCEGYYYKTAGYKKSMKSFCYGGVNHFGKEVKCPNSGVSFSAIFLFIVLIILLILIINFIKNNNSFENFNSFDFFDKFKSYYYKIINKINKLKKKEKNDYTPIDRPGYNEIEFGMDDDEFDDEEENQPKIIKNKINKD